VTGYTLSRSVFGGQGRGLAIRFRLSRRATVRVTVSRGSRTVRRFRVRAYRAGNHRLYLRARGLRRGDYRVTLRAGTTRQTLVARRL
jgi:hypothetical protein